MKKLIPIVLTACSLFAFTSCGKPSHESISEDTIEIMEEMAEVINGVTDEDSAKAAAKKIDQLAERMVEIRKQKKELEAPTQEEKNELEKKYGDRLKKAITSFLAGMVKLQSKPELRQHLEESLKRFNDM